MEINGDCRVFCVINTTAYNDDGRWCVQTCEYAGLDNIGFSLDDTESIDGMKVGEVLDEFDYKGVMVIRIA